MEVGANSDAHFQFVKAETRPGLKIQAHPFLAKPISIPELVAGIEQSLPAQAAS
jgi:hypothetical protein